MIAGSLSHRYARAFLSLAEKAGQIDAVREELDALESVTEATAKLIPFLADPVVPPEKRRQVLVQALDAIKVSELTRRFCLFLLEKNRIRALHDIVRAYDELCDERNKIIRAKVVSARPLAAEESAEFERILIEKTGKKVLVEFAEDPALIGGVKVHVGSLVYDGSIRGELERVEETMLQ